MAATQFEAFLAEEVRKIKGIFDEDGSAYCRTSYGC